MLIRSEQFEAFQKQADEAFEEQLVEHLLWEHADVVVRIVNIDLAMQDIPHAVLHEMVRNGIRRGRGHGLTWESTLTAFVALMFVIAPNFDEQPGIRGVLRGPDVEPDRRLDLLWEMTSDEDWKEAAEDYDPSAWGLTEFEK